MGEDRFFTKRLFAVAGVIFFLRLAALLNSGTAPEDPVGLASYLFGALLGALIIASVGKLLLLGVLRVVGSE